MAFYTQSYINANLKYCSCFGYAQVGRHLEYVDVVGFQLILIRHIEDHPIIDLDGVVEQSILLLIFSIHDVEDSTFLHQTTINTSWGANSITVSNRFLTLSTF